MMIAIMMMMLTAANSYLHHIKNLKKLTFPSSEQLYGPAREVELLNQAFTWTSLLGRKGKHITISLS